MSGVRKESRYTFEQEFEAAAGKLGEEAVKEHLDRLQSQAKSADKSIWEFAKLAWEAKTKLGFNLKNLKEYLTPYSPERVSEFVNTYKEFEDSELLGVANFDLANTARKAYQGFDVDSRQSVTPEAILKSFVGRNLTSRAARRELATINRNKNMARCRYEAVEVVQKHPELLTNCRHADCRMVLEELPKDSVSLILHDPPYLGYERVGVKTYTNGQSDINGMEAEADSLDPQEALAVYCDMIRGAPRVLKARGVLALFLSATMHTDLSALRAMFDAIDDAGLKIVHELFWLKNKIPPKSFSRPFSTQTETIWLLCRKEEDIDDCFDNEKGLPAYLPQQPSLRTNLIHCETETGRFLAARRSGKPRNLVAHQFEKPAEIAMYLIEKLSLPEELVWDSCGCHGNFTLAAIRTGRRFMYSESHADRFAEGVRRINDTVEAAKGAADPQRVEVAVAALPEMSTDIDAGELVGVGAAEGNGIPL